MCYFLHGTSATISHITDLVKNSSLGSLPALKRGSVITRYYDELVHYYSKNGTIRIFKLIKQSAKVHPSLVQNDRKRNDITSPLFFLFFRIPFNFSVIPFLSISSSPIPILLICLWLVSSCIFSLPHVFHSAYPSYISLTLYTEMHFKDKYISILHRLFSFYKNEIYIV